ncbi:phosphoglycerate mutase [Rhodospirillum rubrum]|uniref:histidine phosphatase family protein n=1 Tax=Rhodospirillum rubrum TaxID=1085 RepID=UPI001903B887|nr:histidine phosphatase family protein [Rhodospirillum rubrum]MBK1665555.1 phosphoglycerate mutase [Rhodospirillum rubrum]MBK1677789.1 phosphoglycerate mutase [Rhodospirillum rubrum]
MAPAQASGLFDGPFYFVRHGESVTNRGELIGGWLDVPLSEEGERQAEAVADCLAAEPIRAIVCSTLRRTAQTAAPLASRLGLVPLIVDQVKERHWGDLEGRPMAEKPDNLETPPGGESWLAFRDRVWEGFQAVRVAAPALIVGHSGTMRVLRDRLGIGDSVERIGNARPVRFDPPATATAGWTMTLLLPSD